MVFDFAQPGVCRVWDGEQELPAIPVGPQDVDEGLRLLKRLNRWTLADGRRASEFVTADGFEPWWFVQETLFWRWLVPYVRYQAVITQVLANPGAEIRKAPEELARLLEALAQHGTGVRYTRAPASARDGFERLAARLRIGLVNALLSVVSLLSLFYFRLWGRRILFYAVDKVSPGLRHDFRFDSLYRELHARGLSYGEYIHAGGSGLRRNFLRRWRPVAYFEALAQFLRPWMTRGAAIRLPESAEPLAARAPAEDRFLAAMAAKTIDFSREALLRYRALKVMLRVHRPRLALVFDDFRHANELVAACRELGIFVLAYQHGLAVDQYFPGLLCYGFGSARRHVPDAYGLWSPYFRDLLHDLSELHDRAGTFVCGMLRPPDPWELGPTVPLARGTDPVVKVLFISETLGPAEQKKPYVQELLRHPGFEVGLKLRPGEDREKTRHQWGELLSRVRIVDTASVYGALAEFDVVAGTYSSVLYEALLVHRPVLALAPGSPLGRRLLMNGLVDWVPGPECITSAARTAAALPPEELGRRAAAVWGKTPGDGARAIADMVQARLESRAHG